MLFRLTGMPHCLAICNDPYKQRHQFEQTFTTSLVNLQSVLNQYMNFMTVNKSFVCCSLRCNDVCVSASHLHLLCTSEPGHVVLKPETTK